MFSLKKIPITYKGELHNISLINFSVELSELESMVPRQIKIRHFENNRALISLVNVELKKMHPSSVPESLHFGYRHVAFRLLVDDGELNNGVQKGIYFLKSFTDNPLIAFGGNLFTEYKLTSAKFTNEENEFSLTSGDNFLSYTLTNKFPANKEDSLKEMVGALDRAYSFFENKLRVTQIQREKWPIEWTECTNFKTNFFKTARFEGAFKVNEIIYYTWLPAKNI